MDEIARPPSSASEIEPPAPSVRWRVAGVVLVDLFAVHAGCGIFFWPTGASHSLTQRMIDYAGAGIIIAQPALLAIAAVLAPIRLLVRLPVASALMVLLTYAMAIGIAWNTHPSNGRLAESLILLMLYGMLLPPATLVCWLRRWRVVPRPPWGSLSGRQFSLYGLLAAITLASVVLACGRWVASLGSWPDSIQVWGTIIVDLGLDSLLVAAGCLPILVCTALVLAPRWRVAMLAGWILSILAGIAIVVGGYTYLGMAGSNDGEVALLTSLMLGVYASALASLLVIRWCGYRLVREPRSGAQQRIAGGEA